MGKLLEGLKSYFQNNTKEQILKDWADAEKYDDIGPAISEFLEYTKMLSNQERGYSPWNIEADKNIKNPKFSSDFFYLSTINQI